MNKIRGQTLPRRTNLASYSSRYIAGVLDFALALLITLIFYYACFQFVYNSSSSSLYSTLNSYQVESGLFIANEDGSTSIIEVDEDNKSYLVYHNAVAYYYLTYLTGVDYLTGEEIDPSDAAPNYNEYITLSDGSEVLPKDYYTVKWYNTNILSIGTDPDNEMDTGYFTYQKDEDGNYVDTLLGIAKETRYDRDALTTITITEDDLIYYYDDYYMEAYEHLTYQSFYYEVRESYNFIQSLSLMFPILIAILIVYLLFPLIFKNGETIGKLIFKIGLCNSNGYKLSKWRVLLRPLLMIVLILIVFLFTYNTYLFFSLSILAIPFLVSWVLTMASPKHSALHDYISMTIVIDVKTSIIYKSSIEEDEAYRLEEEEELKKQYSRNIEYKKNVEGDVVESAASNKDNT